MKKILLALISLTTLQAFAQKDLMITLKTPATGTTIYANTPFNITFDVKNNGSVDIAATDSIQIGVVINNQVVSAATLNHNVIAAGQTLNLAFNNYSLNFTTGGSNVNFCLMALLRYNGNLDSNTTNNVSCATVTMSTATGINESEVSANTRVYPNPASNLIHFESSFTKQAFVSVIDMTGKTVKTVEMTSGHASLQVDDLNNGLYLYEIKDAANQLIKAGRFNVAH